MWRAILVRSLMRGALRFGITLGGAVSEHKLVIKRVSQDSMRALKERGLDRLFCDSWVVNLDNLRGNMFNEDELGYIEKNTIKDLDAVKTQIEYLVGELARYGKKLSELKIVESQLTSILDAIEANKEDNKC